jgi:HD-like signal output (HDOD) protein
MRRVLFVDDEPKILDGLRRMLRSLRREWTLDFAEGGREALARLAEAPYDVVVTDMRMPGMDGAALLREVVTRYPSTVRIVLSGQCDRQTVLGAVDSTHQFLTKPCDPESLITTLIRACQLRERLPDDDCRRIVSRVTSVPSLPGHYEALAAELKSALPSLPRVSEIVTYDIGMTAKIMQLTHTSFFGTAQRISNPKQAVSLFDLDTIRALVFSTAAFAPLCDPEIPIALLERLLDHSLVVAAAAREIAIAEQQDASMVDDAYLAGFLHDIGILVIAEHLPHQIRDVLTASANHRQPIADAEMGCAKVTHADIGGYLMALWGLSASVVDAITLHHAPGVSSDQRFTPLTAVHVASAIDEERFLDTLGAASSIDIEYLERLGLANRFDIWREICRSVQPQGALR